MYKTQKQVNEEFDEKFYFLVDNNDKHKETEVKTEIAKIRNQDLESLRQIIKEGNLDPDFEYKQAYYEGHNELQEFLLAKIKSLSEDNK